MPRGTTPTREGPSPDLLCKKGEPHFGQATISWFCIWMHSRMLFDSALKFGGTGYIPSRMQKLSTLRAGALRSLIQLNWSNLITANFSSHQKVGCISRTPQAPSSTQLHQNLIQNQPEQNVGDGAAGREHGRPPSWALGQWSGYGPLSGVHRRRPLHICMDNNHPFQLPRGLGLHCKQQPDGDTKWAVLLTSILCRHPEALSGAPTVDQFVDETWD